MTKLPNIVVPTFDRMDDNRILRQAFLYIPIWWVLSGLESDIVGSVCFSSSEQIFWLNLWRWWNQQRVVCCVFYILSVTRKTLFPRVAVLAAQYLLWRDLTLPELAMTAFTQQTLYVWVSSASCFAWLAAYAANTTVPACVSSDLRNFCSQSGGVAHNTQFIGFWLIAPARHDCRFDPQSRLRTHKYVSVASRDLLLTRFLHMTPPFLTVSNSILFRYSSSSFQISFPHRTSSLYDLLGLPFFILLIRLQSVTLHTYY